MQWRAKRIVGEELLPQSRREFVGSAGRMLADPLQHIDQIVIGIDLVNSVGHDQAMHDPDVFGPEFGPAEHPILRPIGIARSARSRWFGSIGTSGSVRYRPILPTGIATRADCAVIPCPSCVPPSPLPP